MVSKFAKVIKVGGIVISESYTIITRYLSTGPRIGRGSLTQINARYYILAGQTRASLH